jgi:hypothetical protein
MLTPVCGKLKYGPVQSNWPLRSIVAGNLKVKGSPIAFTQYSALSPIPLIGLGLFVAGTLAMVLLLTAKEVVDRVYKDIHKGLLMRELSLEVVLWELD